MSPYANLLQKNSFVDSQIGGRKMSRLSQIESFIKPCVDVISTFVHTQITVVDEELNRICGTNFYKEVPEKFRRKSSVFFKSVLISGYPKLVTQVREDPYCEECKSREICTIHAELGYPIDYQGEIKRKEDIETGKPRRVRRGIFLFWEKAKSAFLKFDASG